jgi:hypothetical protein
MSKAGCDCGLYMENTVKRIKLYQELIRGVPELKELFRECLRSEKGWLNYLEPSHVFFCTGNGDLSTYIKQTRREN